MDLSQRRAVVGLLFLGCLFGASGRARAFEVTNCPPKADSDVKSAARFIEANMSAIVDPYTFLSEEQRQEVVRKWVHLNIHCSDSEKECTGAGGYAHGGLGNRVNVCYYTLSSGGEGDLCDLVRVIMHEQGHAHGFRKVPGHNEPTDYVRDNDVMYRMGYLAEDFCEAAAESGTFDDATLKGGGERGLGSACTEDLQCSSKRCSGGSCVCDQDTDCGLGKRCFKSVSSGNNFCGSSALPVGAACTREDECLSNQCERGRCVCRHDSDCPRGQECKTPITGSNTCVAASGIGSKPLGSLCDRDADCLSNTCEYSKCVCHSDSDCPPGQECYQTLGASNTCRIVGLTMGSGCSKDSQCRSGKCEQSVCVCRHDDDCPSGKKCKTPITGKNRCE